MNASPFVRALAALLLPAVPALAQTRSNVLLIVADDVGVDSIASYGLGATPPPTPNIDALAARGVRFTNAQSCPVCSPTRASLLTGRHGFRTGVGTALVSSSPGLAPSEVLLPEILAPAGITTALIGKWHLGDDLGNATPTLDGFGLFTGTLHGAVSNYFSWPKIENLVSTTSTVYSTTDLVDEALDFIGTAQRPWMLEVAFHAAHSPYHRPPPRLHTQNLVGLDPAVTPIPFYKAMVEAMDTEIGRLLAGIPAAMLANTNVVFIGDNGTAHSVVEPPFDPTRSKGTIYQGGVRVPLIVAGPAVGGSPRVEANLVQAVDLFATIAAMQRVDARAAVPPLVPLDSVNFMPLLQAAGRPPVREFAYSEYFVGAEAMNVAGDAEVIRNARFELLRFQEQGGTVREEMYDLVVDPWETTDLLQQPLIGAAATAYRDLRRALAQLRDYPWVSPYGTGCSGAGISPVLRGVTDPVIGTTFTMRVTGLGVGALAAVGAIGFSDRHWLGLPLPWNMTPLGWTGCTLLASPDIQQVLVRGGTVADWVLPLPNDPALVGLGLFTQSFVLVPGANPAGLLATRALEVVVGSS
jgi:arylsulfatase A-like enzyme